MGHVFLLGAAKSGTTALASMLSSHPDVCLSEPKEPPFFEAEYERGLDYYWHRYFPHYQGERHTLDARQRNLYLPYVPARIRESFKRPRLIAILRNPTDRAYAHWWEWYGGHHDENDLVTAIDKEMRRREAGERFDDEQAPSRWAAALRRDSDGNILGLRNRFPTYVDSGYYAEQLSRYYRCFPAEDLLVLFTEELDAGTAKQRVLDFLGLERAEITAPEEHRAKVRREARHPVVAFAHRVRVQRLVPQRLKDTIRPLLFANRERPPLDPDVRSMLDEHYVPHNRALRDLLGRDLPPGWPV